MFTFVVLCMLETYLTPKLIPKLILNTNRNIKKKKTKDTIISEKENENVLILKMFN